MAMEAPKKQWDRDDIENLIHLYRQSPCLWDYSSISYRKRSTKVVALMGMAKHFNTNVTEIKRKIHNLRNQFNQELMKEKYKPPPDGSNGDHGNEDSTTRGVKWQYYDLMSFIKDSIVSRQETGRKASSFNFKFHSFHVQHKPKLLPMSQHYQRHYQAQPLARFEAHNNTTTPSNGEHEFLHNHYNSCSSNTLPHPSSSYHDLGPIEILDDPNDISITSVQPGTTHEHATTSMLSEPVQISRHNTSTRKRPSATTQKAIITNTNTTTPAVSDDCDIFATYIASEMRQLPGEKYRRLMKRKILNIVLEMSSAVDQQNEDIKFTGFHGSTSNILQ